MSIGRCVAVSTCDNHLEGSTSCISGLPTLGGLAARIALDSPSRGLADGTRRGLEDGTRSGLALTLRRGLAREELGFGTGPWRGLGRGNNNGLVQGSATAVDDELDDCWG